MNVHLIEAKKLVQDWFANEDGSPSKAFESLVMLANAWISEHSTEPPDWYSKNEIYEWLRRQNYSVQIAEELAGLIATNYQRAFGKGFEMGARSVTKTTTLDISGT